LKTAGNAQILNGCSPEGMKSGFCVGNACSSAHKPVNIDRPSLEWQFLKNGMGFLIASYTFGAIWLGFLKVFLGEPDPNGEAF
jgi:hypothetical protein